LTAKLLYSAICSLDGFIADDSGAFDWAAPSDEVLAAVNEQERPIGTYLYGRRMYETMRAWQTMDDPAPLLREFAGIWRGADKIVYSRTLDEATTPRTRLEREFDPEAVRRLKEEATADLTVGGAALAAEALRAGLVDELSLYLNPIAVGRGNPALPGDLRIPLELVEERRFADGVVLVHYRILQG
jgi:dihydrofolate reductase